MRAADGRPHEARERRPDHDTHARRVTNAAAKDGARRCGRSAPVHLGGLSARDRWGAPGVLASNGPVPCCDVAVRTLECRRRHQRSPVSRGCTNLDRSDLGLIIVACTIVVVAILTFVALQPLGPAYAIGVISGLLSGVLVVFVLYFLTGPTLVMSIKNDEYDGVSAGTWLHLVVENRSWNLLGNGTAYDCVGQVKFDNVEMQKTSWESRPNPRQKVVIPTPPGSVVIELADPVLYEQKRTTTIRPGEATGLDIVWRRRGKTDAFVSIPEHFQGATLVEYPNLRLGPGKHRFRVRLVYAGGTTRWKAFVLSNLGGPNFTSKDFHISTS